MGESRQKYSQKTIKKWVKYVFSHFLDQGPGTRITNKTI